MIKKFLAVLLAVMIVSVFCFAKDEGTSKKKIIMVGTNKVMTAKEFSKEKVKANRNYTIAVVVKSAAVPVWESHLIAARKAGKDLGVKIIDYAPSKADNVEEQKRILEDLITSKVDAVVLAPANTEAVQGPVLDLIKSGIPVIYDNTMGPSNVDYLTYVGCDNVEVGVVIADYMGKAINGQGNVLVLEGVPGQSTSDIRTQSIMNRFAAKFPKIKAERVVTKWMFDKGREVTEDYITKWGSNLKAIVAAGGNQAEGAAEAVKSSNLKGMVKIGGFDIQEPQYTAVKNGDEYFSISQGVYDQAYMSVLAAVRALNGLEVPRLITTPITVVTKANLDAMDERPAALNNR